MEAHPTIEVHEEPTRTRILLRPLPPQLRQRADGRPNRTLAWFRAAFVTQGILFWGMGLAFEVYRIARLQPAQSWYDFAAECGLVLSTEFLAFLFLMPILLLLSKIRSGRRIVELVIDRCGVSEHIWSRFDLWRVKAVREVIVRPPLKMRGYEAPSDPQRACISIRGRKWAVPVRGSFPYETAVAVAQKLAEQVQHVGSALDPTAAAAVQIRDEFTILHRSNAEHILEYYNFQIHPLLDGSRIAFPTPTQTKDLRSSGGFINVPPRGLWWLLAWVPLAFMGAVVADRLGKDAANTLCVALLLAIFASLFIWAGVLHFVRVSFEIRPDGITRTTKSLGHEFRRHWDRQSIREIIPRKRPIPVRIETWGAQIVEHNGRRTTLAIGTREPIQALVSMLETTLGLTSTGTTTR